MSAFRYHRPDAIDEATGLLEQDGAVALSGGTDLLVALRHGKTRPRHVVDLKSVREIGEEIVTDQATVVVGGRVVMREVFEHETIRRHFPALVAAAGVVGSVQIRNRATLAGNLCNASPAADTAPALMAYSAIVAVAGRDGDRIVPVESFFVGPGASVLRPGEVVTSIGIPIPTGGTGSAFARVTRRRGVDLASVNLACVVDTAGKVRFGFGAVGPTPLLAESSIDDLNDESGWARLFAATSPISDVRAGADYREAMLRVHSRRAFQAATKQLRETS